MEQNQAWSVTRTAPREFGLAYGPAPLRALADGEVLVRVEYASINYRDMLASKGNPGVARSFPYYPGVDAAGIVAASTSARFREGDAVFVAAVPPNTITPGCWSQSIIAAEAVVKHVPGRLSARDVVICGTAGQSAALGVRAIDRFIGGIAPGQKMLVTGASGGVGSLAVAMLASMGCEVVAASRKTEQADFLTGLGAASVIHPSELTANSAPNLLKEEYSGVVDTLGGEVLVAALKRLRKGGALASAGLVESQQLNLTVLPFLMRGVGLMGTGAEVASEEAQREAWTILEKQLTPAQLDRIAHVIAPEGVPQALAQIAEGQHLGRFVIQMSTRHPRAGGDL